MFDCRDSSRVLGLSIAFGLLANAAAQDPLVGHNQPDDPIVENPPGFHSLNPIETAWINEVLCPGFFVSCGLGNESPDQPVGTDARWQQISLEKHYSMTAGRFSIKALVSGFDRETHQLIVTTSPTFEV